MDTLLRENKNSTLEYAVRRLNECLAQEEVDPELLKLYRLMYETFNQPIQLEVIVKPPKTYDVWMKGDYANRSVLKKYELTLADLFMISDSTLGHPGEVVVGNGRTQQLHLFCLNRELMGDVAASPDFFRIDDISSYGYIRTRSVRKLMVYPLLRKIVITFQFEGMTMYGCDIHVIGANQADYERIRGRLLELG